ncbi:helix-turn-helix domain-containing protein [Bosea vestrisii]|uniref:Helix-turn-helix domain-containing protein n=1 Tax=Bosea vestrisii TaxID=151416 RepID=A0ABW0HA22_9HYPH
MAIAPIAELRTVDWTDQEFYAARAAWQSWVRSDAKLSMTARCVAFEISDRMGPDNNGSWPSQKFIGARLGCKERTVREAISELFDRGWLLARRGGFEGKNGELRKSGFRASYTYIMTVHPQVLAEVLASEQGRMVAYHEEVQSAPYRQKIAALLLSAKPAESCRVDRQKVAAHTGENPPLIPAESCRIIYPDNLSSEPVHGTSEERGLSEETIQDEALGVSDALDPVVDDARLHRDVHLALGGGDIDLGRMLAEAIGRQQVDRLKDRVRVDGVIGAADELSAAAARARRLLQSKAEGADHVVA